MHHSQVFEEHGEVEEVFIMRGGSRSGMVCAFVEPEPSGYPSPYPNPTPNQVCAFVRFLTQESAQKVRRRLSPSGWMGVLAPVGG